MLKSKWCRQPHIMHGNKMTRTPDRFLALACTYVEHSSTEDGKGKYWTLAKCATQLWHNDNGTWKSEHPRVHADKHYAWIFMYHEARVKGKLVIVSANLAKDISVLGLAAERDNGIINVGFTVLANPPTIVEWEWKDGRKVIAVDVRNFLRSQTVFDKSVEKTLAHHECFKGDNVRTDVLLSTKLIYVAQQFQDYLDFIAQNDLGNWQPTISGQALQAFRHRFMYNKIVLHGSAAITKLERQSYRGGRCEAFYRGKYHGRVYVLDVNSLFPYIMSKTPLPVRCVDHEIMCKMANAYFSRVDLCIIARCRLKTSRYQYPYYCNGRVCCASGEFTSVLSNEEFKRALRSDEIVSVGEYAAYEARVIFDRYVAWFKDKQQAYKQANDDRYARLCKDFLVSLYGKFGQRKTDWVDDPNEWLMEEFGQWWVRNTIDDTLTVYRNSAGVVEKQVKDNETNNSFPAIASCITSAARVYMDKVREIAGNDEVLHQYVDCIIVTEAGYLNLKYRHGIIGDNMGQLRLEDTYDGAEITAANQWRVGEDQRLPGIPAQASRLADGQLIYDVEDTQQSVLSNSRPGRYATQRVVARLRDELSTEEKQEGHWLKGMVVSE